MVMIPKSWAVLTDALDEGAAQAANLVLDVMHEFGPLGLRDEDRQAQRRDAMINAIHNAVRAAICERFRFDDGTSE